MHELYSIKVCWQCMTELRVTTLDDVEALLLSFFYGALPESKSGMEMPKVPVVSRYLVSFVAVAPFFRAKDERVQTGTVKFFDKALSKLAGMKDTALSAYLHRKATAWYKRFPPIHSPDRAEDPTTPQVDGGDGAGGSPEDEEDVAERPVASESSSTDDLDEGRQ